VRPHTQRSEREKRARYLQFQRYRIINSALILVGDERLGDTREGEAEGGLRTG